MGHESSCFVSKMSKCSKTQSWRSKMRSLVVPKKEGHLIDWLWPQIIVCTPFLSLQSRRATWSYDRKRQKREERWTRSRGAIHIRQRRVKKGQNGVFVRRKVVQFQNGIISEKRSQGSGSIPEWNLEILLVAVDWFNSLVAPKIVFVQSPPRHVPSEEKTT